MLTSLFLRPIENLARVISFSRVTYNLFICRMGGIEYYLHGGPYKGYNWHAHTHICIHTYIHRKHARVSSSETHPYTRTQAKPTDKGELSLLSHKKRSGNCDSFTHAMHIVPNEYIYRNILAGNYYTPPPHPPWSLTKSNLNSTWSSVFFSFFFFYLYYEAWYTNRAHNHRTFSVNYIIVHTLNAELTSFSDGWSSLSHIQ